MMNLNPKKNRINCVCTPTSSESIIEHPNCHYLLVQFTKFISNFYFNLLWESKLAKETEIKIRTKLICNLTSVFTIVFQPEYRFRLLPKQTYNSNSKTTLKHSQKLNKVLSTTPCIHTPSTSTLAMHYIIF